MGLQLRWARGPESEFRWFWCDGLNRRYGHFPSAHGRRSHKNVYIGNCKVFDNRGIPEKKGHSGTGIVISGVDGAVIEYCEAFNNGELNRSTAGGPIGIWAWESSNVVIQFCESHHNKTGTLDGGGFDLDGGCVNSTLQYNYSHDNYGAGYGLYQFKGASAFKDNIVRYNISENDGQIGGYGAIYFRSTRSHGGIQNTRVYNNTLHVSAKTTGAGIGEISDEPSISPVHNSEVCNNIIVTAPEKHVVDIPRPAAGWSFKGDCYWTAGEHPEIKWNGIVYSSLSGWRSATGQETLKGAPVGFHMEPRLAKVGGGATIGDPAKLQSMTAYMLLADSPMIDSGLDLRSLFGIEIGERDFYGAQVPQLSGYDVGACESEIAHNRHAENTTKN